MLSHKTKIRVRYADTDQMKFVYNGKYLEYFEVGRTEMLRENGLPYSRLEKSGYQLPLLEAKLTYKSPGFYDDVLIIEASVKEMPVFRIHIDYNITREETGDLVVEGYTDHVFINEKNKRPVRPPKFFLEAMKPFFEKIEN